MTLVENDTPLEPGVIVTGTPVVKVVILLPLIEDSTTCDMVVVYAVCTVVVIQVV